MPEIIALNAALTLAETLIPRVADLFRRGEITPEQQAELRARYVALRDATAEQFTGPEWKIE